MENSSTPAEWQSVLSASFEQLLAYLLAYLPQLFGAILLIVVGWLLAFILSKLTLTLLSLVNRLVVRIAPSFLRDKQIELKPAYLVVVSKSVFWLVILFFIAAATKILGLDFFASSIKALIAYLPRLLAGALIIFFGFLLGNIAKAMAKAAAESSGMQQPDAIGTFVKVAVVFTSLVIGVEQIGINVRFVTNLVVILSGVLTAGVALAFGLGCKELVSNVVGARQAKKYCQLQESISIAGVEGVLVDISNTMLVLETEKGKIMLPASFYLNNITTVSEPPN